MGTQKHGRSKGRCFGVSAPVVAAILDVLDLAHLEISRNHPQDIQDRPVYLWIDGEKWDGVLKYGATFTRDLTPGPHTIKANNTLFSHTVKVDVADGETVRFRCENGLTGGGMVMVLMMGVAYLRVRLTRL
jgi:hypothetical protein